MRPNYIRLEESSALRRIDGRPLRAVVVEDQILVRFDLELMLAEHGGDVVATTGNGAESIALVERYAPDVVLMDVCVDGEMDGIDTAHIIKNRFAVPVVFVTGSGDEATRARIAELGDSQLILKPARSIDLVTAIRRACGLHAGQA